jgi:hypothetical protein
MSPIGTIQPNGQPMRLELINFFRYHEVGHPLRTQPG